MTQILVYLAIAYYLLVFVLAIGVITDNRNPAKTLAYMLALILMPIVGLVVYVMFGQNLRKHNLFSRKRISRNPRIKAWEDGHRKKFEAHVKGMTDVLHEKTKVATLLKQTDDAILTSKNELEVLNECEEIFKRLFEDIRAAKHHLHLEFYIIEDDIIGNELKQLLVKKAQEGIEVRVCVDDVGSRKLPLRYYRQLQKAGVEIYSCLPVFFPYLTGKANFRNHRKIVVIDGRVAYLGGINIADRYTNRRPNVRYWRDTQLRMVGDAVLEVQKHFAQMWQFVSKKEIPTNKMYFPSQQVVTDCLTQVVASGPDTDWPSIMQAMIVAISSAEKYVYITTPYLIPSEEMLVALQIAALSGIDVQIIVPRIGDSALTQAASMSYIRQLLEAGVKILRYEKGFIHAKTLVIDGSICTIGTTNMDNRSFHLNFEINAFVYDAKVAQHVAHQFFEDSRYASPITLAHWAKRTRLKKVRDSFARIFAPLL